MFLNLGELWNVFDCVKNSQFRGLIFQGTF